jgi:hypothetical protein
MGNPINKYILREGARSNDNSGHQAVHLTDVVGWNVGPDTV